MKLGYLAVSQYGTKYMLTDLVISPRQQLLDKCHRQHADKMYVDKKDGTTKHIGYIVAGEWFTIYEVHAWEGKS